MVLPRASAATTNRAGTISASTTSVTITSSQYPSSAVFR
jgi:hypothetical protein